MWGRRAAGTRGALPGHRNRPHPFRSFPLLGTIGVALLLALPLATGTSASLAAHPAAPSLPRGGALGPPSPASSPASTTWGRNYTWSSASSSPDAGEGGGLIPLGSGLADLFGGQGPSGLLNTSTKYTEATNSWATLTTPRAPSPRQDFAFSIDRALDEAILFGGETNLTSGQSDNETWLFYGSNLSWRPLSPAPSPAPRQDGAFALAPWVNVGVLFGGLNQSYGTGELTYGDTWIFSMATMSWTPWNSSGKLSPSGRDGASMLWDPAVHRFDLLGGSCNPFCSNVLWRFDPWNLTWTEWATSNTPAVRGLAAVVYDPADGVDVLFGGENSGGALDDAWMLNPTSLHWTLENATPSPSARYDAAATWLNVATNETMLVVGGTDGTSVDTDAWRFAPTGYVPVQVFDQQTLLPISGAKVTDDGSFGATTNAHGFGNTSAVPSGGVTIAASAPGFLSASTSLWLDPGSTSSLVQLYLPPQPVGDLSVQVLTPDPTHRPISGVDVNVTFQGVLVRSPPLTTNAHGYANYTNVLAGETLVVTAWKLGYRANSTPLQVLTGQLTSWVSLLYTLPVLSLRVLGYNSTLGSPVVGHTYPFPGATVAFNGTTGAVSGPGGWLNLSFNRTGPLSVEAFFPYYTAGWANTSLPYSGTVSVLAQLQALLPDTVTVGVIDSASSLPIVGAEVNDTSLGIPQFQLLTNLSGGATATGAYSGPSELTVWAPGYYAQAYFPAPFLYAGPPPLWWNVSLVRQPVLVVQVHGLELNGTSVPLPGSLVDYNGGYGGTTGVAGFYNFTPARAGSVELRASHLLFFDAYLNLTVNYTGVRWVNMTLDHLPAAGLSVQVLDRDNALPIAGALVNGSFPTGPNETRSNAHGYANFTTVIGTAYAGALEPKFYPGLGKATLLADVSTPMELALVPYPFVHLKVYGENATAGPYPLYVATVSFNSTIVGYTDARGDLNVTSYSGGNEYINASSALYYPQSDLVHLNYTGSLNVTFILKERPLATLDIRLEDSYTHDWIPFGFANVTNLDPVPTTAGGVRITERSGWGNFTDDLGNGSYELVGSHSGYQVSRLEMFVDWGESYGPVILSLNPILPYVGVYADVVNANDTSEPIDNALVEVNYAYAAYTNTEGNATFPPPDVPGGDYYVAAAAYGYNNWTSERPYAFYAGSHLSLYIELYPAAHINCTSGPLCQTSNTTQNRTGFSLLPFAAGPWWPFLLLPPLFLLGALVYAMASRRSNSRPVPRGVVVAPSYTSP